MLCKGMQGFVSPNKFVSTEIAERHIVLRSLTCLRALCTCSREKMTAFSHTDYLRPQHIL
jgi:hypothetical protein